jgi:hypothetical protein
MFVARIQHGLAASHSQLHKFNHLSKVMSPTIVSHVGQNVSSPCLAHISCRLNDYTPFTSGLLLKFQIWFVDKLRSMLRAHISFGECQVFSTYLAQIVCRSTTQTQNT